MAGSDLPFLLVREGKPNPVLRRKNPQLNPLRKNSNNIPRKHNIPPLKFKAHFTRRQSEIRVEERVEHRYGARQAGMGSGVRERWVWELGGGRRERGEGAVCGVGGCDG
jgi:hypothetical protein